MSSEPRRRSLPLVVIPVLLLWTLFAVVVRGAMYQLNIDAFFHLRFGQEFLDGWSLQHPGSVSVFATREWQPTQWLSEIIMAKGYDWFGLGAIGWLSGVTILATMLVTFRNALRESTVLVAAPVTALVYFASTYGLGSRPQLVSYLFMALTVGAWLRTRRDLKLRWWLIPLTWVWAMMHGMWPVGIAVSVAAAIGLACDHRELRTWKVFAIPVGSAVAAALTPVGPGLYAAVLLVNGRAHLFSEWRPPDFTAHGPATVAVMVGTALLLRLRRERPDWTQALLLMTAFAWMVYSTRTIPMAAVLIAPLLAGTVQGDGRRPGARRIDTAAAVAGFVTAVLALTVVSAQPGANAAIEPAWVQPKLSAYPEGTRIITNWPFGSYLVWKYPRLDPTIFGYADTYTDAEIENANKLIETSPGWEEIVRSTGARVALLSPHDNLAYGLERSLGWKKVGSTEDVVLLVAP